MLDKLDLFFNCTLGNGMNQTTSQNFTACFFLYVFKNENI